MANLAPVRESEPTAERELPRAVDAAEWVSAGEVVVWFTEAFTVGRLPQGWPRAAIDWPDRVYFQIREELE